VLGVAYFHQHELIDVVLGETMEVLQEEFQLLVGERLVVSVVSHALTLRLSWVARPLRPELSAGRSSGSGGLVSRPLMAVGGRLRSRWLLYFAAVLQRPCGMDGVVVIEAHWDQALSYRLVID
jgi:hypothetical protein